MKLTVHLPNTDWSAFEELCTGQQVQPSALAGALIASALAGGLELPPETSARNRHRFSARLPGEADSAFMSLLTRQSPPSPERLGSRLLAASFADFDIVSTALAKLALAEPVQEQVVPTQTNPILPASAASTPPAPAPAPAEPTSHLVTPTIPPTASTPAPAVLTIPPAPAPRPWGWGFVAAVAASVAIAAVASVAASIYCIPATPLPRVAHPVTTAETETAGPHPITEPETSDPIPTTATPRVIVAPLSETVVATPTPETAQAEVATQPAVEPIPAVIRVYVDRPADLPKPKRPSMLWLNPATGEVSRIQ